MIKRFFSQKFTYDLAVIGAGPGGYVGAIKAAQLGLKTVCIEKNPSLGGTCLNVGCIPSKTLLNISHKYHDLMHLKDFGLQADNPSYNWDQILKIKQRVIRQLDGGIKFLFKQNGVDLKTGLASLIDKNNIEVDLNGKKETISAKNVMIATGSEAISLPGFDFDEKQIISSTGALKLQKVPEHLIVIGAGVIGLELGSVYKRMGSKVTVIEYLDRICPSLDNQVGRDFLKILKKGKMEFQFNKKCLKSEKNGDKVKVMMEDTKTGKQSSLEGDVVLISTGRSPFTKNLNLDKIGVEMDQQGRVLIDEKFQTNVKNIYAIGDVVEGPMLAHKAEEEGIAVAEYLSGKNIHLNYSAIPGVIYTYPEVAFVGFTEEALKAQKVKYKIGYFPLSANSRAKANVENVQGMVKILADKETDRILGAHIIAPSAGDLIQELVLAIEYGASSEDIARTSHAHPSLSEALKEAALSAYFKPIHS